MSLAVVVEGDTDLPYVRKMVAGTGLEIWTEIDAAGKGNIDCEIAAYNLAAKGSPWLVLRDLDHDAECAAALIQQTGLVPSEWMCFRIAVREVESWALADTKAFAQFLRVSPMLLPDNPDLERDPTETIVNLARRSTSPRIKKGMVPKAGASASVGPLYEALLIEFGETIWEPDRAALSSASLNRSYRRLRELGLRWRTKVG